MRKLLLFLLLTVSGYSQTASLIAHITTAETEDPVTSVTMTGAQAANAIIAITSGGVGISDSDGHSFVRVLSVSGFGGMQINVWAALGATISASDVITTNNNYGHISSLIMAWSNIASFDKSSVQTDTNQTPLIVGPLTPTNPNSVLIAAVKGAYNTTPIVTLGGSPAWTKLDTGPMHYTGMETFTDGYAIQGGTATSATLQATTNQNNGQLAAVLAFTTAASPLPLTVSPTSLPSIMRTKAYPQTCIVPAGGAAPYTITLTDGTLPAGLTFDGHCINGNPTTTGTTTGLVFHVVDHAGATVNTNAMSITVTPLVTTMDLQGPNYGFVVFPGAKRHPGVLETTPGATGKVNWSVSDSTKATLSCTTDCAGTVTVTATGTAGNCSISGTVGSYSVTGGNDFTLTASSRDQNEDGTYSSASETYHICKGDHLVDVQPAYNQAFFGQQKITYGYVMGQIGQALTWTCTAPDNSSCNSALDVNLPTGSGAGTQRHNRDVTFTAPSVVGSYKLTACSASDYDGTQACNYEWIYVGGALTSAHTGTTALPVSPEGTEVQACFPDPRFGARSWTVKADGTGDFTHMWGPILDDAAGGNDKNGGFLVRVFNQDTTGSSPTQYHDFFYIRDGGTRDKPSVVCGVADASGHLPIQQRQGLTGNGRDQGYFGTIFQGFMIGVVPGNSSLTGFDTPNGPDNVYIWGLHQVDSGHFADAIGVEVAPGSRHVAMEGIHSDWMQDGALMNNNTNYSGTHYAEFNASIGGHYENCGDADNSQGSHCLYMESMYPLIVNNLFSGQHPGGGGLANKVRGGGSIIAFNSYLGSYGYPVIAWPAMTDTGGFTSVENNLGVPGDPNCGESAYCNIMSTTGDENWLHMAANEQALAEAYLYSNIFSQASGAMYGILEYGAQNINQCNAPGPSCTNGIDHTGGLYIWNNTFDREGGAISISSNVIYNNNKGYAAPVRTYPWLYYQNNSMFNAGTEPDGGTPPPFQIDMAPYFQGGLQTNLIATGSLDLSTPIIVGHTGWSDNLGGNGDPIQPWTAYSPKDSYLSGVSTFTTTSTIPYNTTTFKPTAGSPLVGAGTTISEPLMALLPVRWEPDPVNGYVAPRTESVTTIGARSSGIAAPLSVTTTSLAGGTVGVAYTACASATGGTSPYTWTLTGTPPTGLTLNTSTGCLSGTPTSAGTYGSLIFHATDAAAATANSQTLSITIAAAPSNPTPPTVTTSSLPSGTAGTPYTFTLTATGGSTPYTWARTGGTLPAGLTLNTSTGVISGTPTTAGTTTGLVFTATGNDAQSGASSSLTLVIAAPAPPPSTGGTSINGNATITGGVVIQ